MPKTKKIKKNQPPPEGYSKIQPTLTKYLDKLKDAQSKQDPTKTKTSGLWKIYQLNHQISKFVYQSYKDDTISRDLYDWLLLQSYVNTNLILKWKKLGYEKLCCLQCISESVCICRVPKHELLKNDPEKATIECNTCGCKGCSSND